MIGVKLNGRMGNQMFQYAFGYTIAKQRRNLLFIDDFHGYYNLGYFRCSYNKVGFFLTKVKRRLFTYFYANPSQLIQIGHEPIETIVTQILLSNYFDGYFQSEQFFLPYKKRVKKLFKIKNQYRKEFVRKYSDIFERNKTIVVHIRLTDYLQFDVGNKHGGVNPSLPFEYFDKVLENFNLNEYKVIFISDDINAVKTYFKREDFLYESNPEIIDMQLLMNADVLCLSNSSFSWWGAYLNAKSNKQVFVPKYWLGFKTKTEYPTGIICDNWIQIEI